MTSPAARIGLWSGVGLVSADMIGAGVFLSAGYMAQTMDPPLILASWVLGMALAMCGARAYAEVAALVPRSGGEYRYLSELAHPALGYLAGWASLLVGFSAPVAINALGAADFLGTVIDLPDHRVIATVVIAALTAIHSVGLTTSKRSQDLMSWLKIALVVGFVAVGLALGAHALPTWFRPAGTPSVTLDGFLESQFYLVFAFAGWNAVVYVAEEFGRPRDVARAMLLGCAGVGVLYLLVNFVLVANVTPAAATVLFGDTPTTVGHVVMATLIGTTGAKIMSVVVVIALISAASAMTFIGPRVYAAMARDGFLPAALAGTAGRPPVGSVVLQGGIALAVVWLHDLRGALKTAGAILMLFAALTCASLFRLALAPGDRPRPRPIALVAAAVYVVVGGGMLYFGFRDAPVLLGWCAAAAAGALATYAATRRLSATPPAR